MKEQNISRRGFLQLALIVPLATLKLPELGRNLEGTSERIPGVIYEFKTFKPEYAVTVDDCFYPDQLVATLDALKKDKIQATFFIVGNGAIYCEQKVPGIVQRLVDEGHYLAYHTMGHDSIEKLSSVGVEWFRQDYQKWEEHIKKYLRPDSFGAIKPWARAPWGLFNSTFMQLCKEKDLAAFFWSADEGTLSRRIPLKKGDIILFHARATSVEWISKLRDISTLSPAPMDSFMEPEITEQERLRLEYRLNRIR